MAIKRRSLYIAAVKNQIGFYPTYGDPLNAGQAVLATITDKRLLTENPNNSDPNTWYWDADIVSAHDYYLELAKSRFIGTFACPDMYVGGMIMPDRLYQADDDGYRYGFNSLSRRGGRMERDDEWNGAGNSYDFGARIYDSRIGRWLARDPFEVKYPSISTYSFCANNPLFYIDPDGRDRITYLTIITDKGTIKLKVVEDDIVMSKLASQYDDPDITFHHVNKIVVLDLRIGISEDENQSYESQEYAGEEISIWDYISSKSRLAIKAFESIPLEGNYKGNVEGGIHFYHSGADGIMGQGQETQEGANAEFIDIADVLDMTSGAIPTFKGGGLLNEKTTNAYIETMDVLSKTVDVQSNTMQTILGLISKAQDGNGSELGTSGEPVDTVCAGCKGKPHGLMDIIRDKNGNTIDTLNKK